MASWPELQRDFEQFSPTAVIENSLRTTGWASVVNVEEGRTHLYAGRPGDLPDVDIDLLVAHMGLWSGSVNDSEHLEIGTAGEDSHFEGKTYVNYTGTDSAYLDHIVGGLMMVGEQAAKARHFHLRRLEAAGTTGGLLLLGAAYAFLNRK